MMSIDITPQQEIERQVEEALVKLALGECPFGDGHFSSMCQCPICSQQDKQATQPKGSET
jgi:hypothetical protein